MPTLTTPGGESITSQLLYRIMTLPNHDYLRNRETSSMHGNELKTKSASIIVANTSEENITFQQPILFFCNLLTAREKKVSNLHGLQHDHGWTIYNRPRS